MIIFAINAANAELLIEVGLFAKTHPPLCEAFAQLSTHLYALADVSLNIAPF